MATAVFGGGCFWCTEAIFKRLRGVSKVVPGYAGGDMPNPGYEDVSGGDTGHAEVIQLEFNPEEISYSTLLEVFFHTHNPCTMDRQGNDIGEQYRSVIFFTSEEQKMAAQNAIKKLEASGEFLDPIVTQVLPLDQFFEAEKYHHDYYAKNAGQSYCQVVIDPKIHKLLEKYGKLVKEEFKK